MTRKLTIGTRGSKLALWQSRHIAQRLRQTGVEEVELEVITTTGDRLVDRHPGQMSTKGIFVKEIEDALLQEKIDLAVHSMKDLPTEIPAGLTITAITEREDPRDALVSADQRLLQDLPAGAKVGTGSLRRQTQILHHRPDLVVVPIRGNVETRLKKLESG
ncbi:MAG: hydroxymethylbilane synthase [Deltaproteobacteria bacterium]|nr:hydroxymethylbilane synthase [Deltaproteobacteria bacterium]